MIIFGFSNLKPISYSLSRPTDKRTDYRPTRRSICRKMNRRACRLFVRSTKPNQTFKNNFLNTKDLHIENKMKRTCFHIDILYSLLMHILQEFKLFNHQILEKDYKVQNYSCWLSLLHQSDAAKSNPQKNKFCDQFTKLSNCFTDKNEKANQEQSK